MDENDGWLIDQKDLEIIIQGHFASFLHGPLSLEIRNVAILASSQDL